MRTKQKQPKSKKAGNARKTPKSVAPATTQKATRTRDRDPRLPAAGTTLTRNYKGKEYRVKVLADGFEHEGKPYRSLTALAREITGYPAISGPAWWGIAERPAATPKAPAPKRKGKAPATDVAPESTAPAESATV